MFELVLNEYTANSDALGTLRILEAIRILNLHDKTKFIKHQHLNYTKGMKFHKTRKHLTQDLLMLLQSGILIGSLKIIEKHIICLHQMVFYLIMKDRHVVKRLYKKTTQAVARISLGSEEILYLGNLNSKRDWVMQKTMKKGR